MSLSQIITWIIIGGIAGFVAEKLIGGFNLGCIGTVIVGVVGAFIGGWLFSFFHISLGLSGLIGDIVIAFVGAVVLLLVIRLFRGR